MKKWSTQVQLQKRGMNANNIYQDKERKISVRLIFITYILHSVFPLIHELIRSKCEKECYVKERKSCHSLYMVEVTDRKILGASKK